MGNEGLEEFESVRKWKASLIANSKKGTISDRTWSGCKSYFNTYLEFVNGGPVSGLTSHDLLAEAQADPDKAKARMMSWYVWLQGKEVRGYKPWIKEDRKGNTKPGNVSQGTAVTYLARVRGFYSHNKVSFGKWRMPKRRVSETQRADARVDVFKFDEENGELYVDTPLLQQFMAQLNFRDQTIALSIYSTSQDPADLFQLTMGWLREQDEDEKEQKIKRLFWQGNRSKTGEPFKVFFSVEATEFIRRYAKQERAGAGDDEPVWVKGKEYSYLLEDGTEVEVGGVMDTATLNENFRNAALAMKVTKKDQPNPFRPKRFRHLFRNACTSAGLDPGIAQVFMGHKTSISASYLGRAKGWLLSQYVKVEPFLTVFKSNQQMEIDSIREEMNLARADLETAGQERDDFAAKLRDMEEALGATNSELAQVREERGLVDRVTNILMYTTYMPQQFDLLREYWAENPLTEDEWEMLREHLPLHQRMYNIEVNDATLEELEPLGYWYNRAVRYIKKKNEEADAN